MKTVAELYNKLFSAIWKKLPEARHPNITAGDLPALLTCLKLPEFKDLIGHIKLPISNCLKDTTGMGQNALQWVSRHFPDEIKNLRDILGFLDAGSVADLLLQQNNKGSNLLGHLVYWCDSVALQAWLPVLQALNADVRAKCLSQRVSGWYIPRFVACARPACFPAILSLMKGLEPDRIEILINDRDAWGRNLEEYLALYAASLLEGFREMVSFTGSGEPTAVVAASSSNDGHLSQFGFFAAHALPPEEQHPKPDAGPMPYI
ncbi:hypothetical protein [Legionella sp. CNM-4043-24]|uniref:hypothetical protein n=1 Tax=Legionella sp. CNM-4043-24 TaxID=3421646 RepID=UPI00403ADBE1